MRDIGHLLRKGLGRGRHPEMSQHIIGWSTPSKHLKLSRASALQIKTKEKAPSGRIAKSNYSKMEATRKPMNS